VIVPKVKREAPSWPQCKDSLLQPEKSEIPCLHGYSQIRGKQTTIQGSDDITPIEKISPNSSTIAEQYKARYPDKKPQMYLLCSGHIMCDPRLLRQYPAFALSKISP
jgi:hypothetical protein